MSSSEMMRNDDGAPVAAAGATTTAGTATAGAEPVEVPDATSQRICAHMNDDHAVTVYVMAKSQLPPLQAGWKLSDARLKKVTRTGCTIQAITCRHDMCEAHTVIYPFDPPLSSAAEAKARLIAIHHGELQPHWKTMIRKPKSILHHPFMWFLYWSYCFATPEMLEQLLNSLGLTDYINLSGIIISSGETSKGLAMKHTLDILFYAAFLGHIVLALVAAFQGYRQLKLSSTSIAVWFFYITVFGYSPYFIEFQSLLRVHRKSLENKKK